MQRIVLNTARCRSFSSALLKRPLKGAVVHPSLLSTFGDSSIRAISYTQRRLRGVEYDGVSDAVSDIINDHARQPQTSVSLQALMRTGRGEFLHKHFADTEIERHTATEMVLMQVASFLRRELPIRLAHRVQDLEGVPLMKDMESVKEVKELYIKSLLELAAFDIKIVDAVQEEAFARLVESIYERHSRVLVQMARGAYEYRNHVSKDQRNSRDTFAKMEETHAFLDRFYLCRK